jgi:hypothetical protein
VRGNAARGARRRRHVAASPAAHVGTLATVSAPERPAALRGAGELWSIELGRAFDRRTGPNARGASGEALAGSVWLDDVDEPVVVLRPT